MSAGYDQRRRQQLRKARRVFELSIEHRCSMARALILFDREVERRRAERLAQIRKCGRAVLPPAPTRSVDVHAHLKSDDGDQEGRFWWQKD